MPINQIDALNEDNLTKLLNYSQDDRELLYSKLKDNILPELETADLTDEQKKLLAKIFIKAAELLIHDAHSKTIDKKHEEAHESYEFADRLLNYSKIEFDANNPLRALFLGVIQTNMNAEQAAIITLQEAAKYITTQQLRKESWPSPQTIHAAIATANFNLSMKQNKNEAIAKQAILHSLIAILYYQQNYPLPSKNKKQNDDNELSGTLDLSKYNVDNISELEDLIDATYFSEKDNPSLIEKLGSIYIRLGTAYSIIGLHEKAVQIFSRVIQNINSENYPAAYVFQTRAMLGLCMSYLKQTPPNTKQADIDLKYTSSILIRSNDFSRRPSIISQCEYLQAEYAATQKKYSDVLKHLDQALRFARSEVDSIDALTLLNKTFNSILSGNADIKKFKNITLFKEKLFDLITALDLPLQKKALEACLNKDTPLGELMWRQRGIKKVTSENKTFTKIQARLQNVEAELAKLNKQRSGIATQNVFSSKSTDMKNTASTSQQLIRNPKNQ